MAAAPVVFSCFEAVLQEYMTQLLKYPPACLFTLPPPLTPTNRDMKYLWRYQEAVEAVKAKLLEKSFPGELWFVGELIGETFSPKVRRTLRSKFSR